MKTRIIPCLLLMFAMSIVQADPLGTAFTYQGLLNADGRPANGIYDFRFRLASDSLANNYVGSPFLTNAISVSNGLFTVAADFGAGIFVGSNYWLEVDVRTNGVGGYTALAPLQVVTPTPYAFFAKSASSLLGVLPASQLSGTVTSAANFTGNLSGDVIGTQTATVVSSVGGQTAANVANGISAVNSATDANNANAIVRRDSNGNFSAGSVSLNANLNLPGTTAIYFGGSPFIHDYGSFNFFGGLGAGKLTAEGSDNVGIGASALSQSSGNANTAIGYQALSGNNTGNANIALGVNAGSQLTTGSHNICIGNTGVAGDDGVIRIGDQNTYDAIIPCIYNDNIASGIPVYISSQGALGVMTSSAKFKQNIESMGDASDVLLNLKPVTFQYKPNMDPEGIPQFGLVAEDVEKVDPALVVHDAKHGIYTVRYQAVDAMLLNEFLKEHRMVESQSNQIEQLQQTVAQLKEMVNKLAAGQNTAEAK